MTENRKHNVAQEETPKYTEQEKNAIMERLWLTYFNDTLYNRGIITESSYNQMRNWINSRKPQKHCNDRAR